MKLHIEHHHGPKVIELPDNAVGTQLTHVAQGERVVSVVTWLELSPSERYEMMQQQQRARGVGFS